MKNALKNVSRIAVYRGEGRLDDSFWPALTWKEFKTPEDLDAALTKVAYGIDHEGYDKFDVEVTCWDGKTTYVSRWDLHRNERVTGAVRQILGSCGAI